jgi:lysyl-tRNA synthetase class 1
MEKGIIGRGTWLDKVAFEILEREERIGRKVEVLRTESGLGASGIPHVGSLGDCARAYGIKLALEGQGQKSEYIAFSDDKDGLRKAPAGLPNDLNRYLGFPVSSIPDPFGCHGSYGEHMSTLLVDALDKCGIEYKFYSGTKAYKEGLFNKQIEILLTNAKRVGEIIREELGQEKYTEVLPYFPVCSNCGRIYTTKAYSFLPEESKILYQCEGLEIKGKWIEGCEHKGEVDYRTGDGKLSWKVEFAARWTSLGINFEAYGKDIADSVRVNDRICRDILGYAPPFHVQYEMFLDKGGKKISKSTGNVFTPQVWLMYGSPQSLLLLMFKRIVGTRVLSPLDIPQYMTEMDELEDVYFGRKTVADRMELAKLKGLYEYCWLLKAPRQPSVHVPYNLLVYLAKVAPKGFEIQYVNDKLREYGYVKNTFSEDLKRRVEYARSWAGDFVEIQETAVKLSEQERKAVARLVEVLRIERDEKAIQNAIFNSAKSVELEPRDFFKLLYRILLGTSEGPKLGSYVVAMGNENVIDTLQRAISQ